MNKLTKMSDKLNLSNPHVRKFLSMFLSIKVQILAAACTFLYLGKLDQTNWVTVALTLAGFRTFDKATSAYASSKNAQNGVKKNVTK